MKGPYGRRGEGETKGLGEELKGQYWDHPKRSPPGLLGKWHPRVSRGLVTSGSANKAWGVVGQARTSTRVCSQPAGHTVQSVLLPPAQVIRPWPAELWSVSSRCQRLSCVPSPRPHPDPVLEEERWGSLGEEVSPITLPPEVRRRLPLSHLHRWESHPLGLRPKHETTVASLMASVLAAYSCRVPDVTPVSWAQSRISLHLLTLSPATPVRS